MEKPSREFEGREDTRCVSGCPSKSLVWVPLLCWFCHFFLLWMRNMHTASYREQLKKGTGFVWWGWWSNLYMVVRSDAVDESKRRRERDKDKKNQWGMNVKVAWLSGHLWKEVCERKMVNILPNFQYRWWKAKLYPVYVTTSIFNHLNQWCLQPPLPHAPHCDSVTCFFL